MSDGTLQLNLGAGGRVEDVEDLIGAGGVAVLRQRLQICGAILAEVARVINVDPTGAEYGLVTRNIPQRAAGTVVTNVASNVASVQLLAANAARKKACFVNLATTGVLFLKLGAAASQTSCTVRIVPGGYYETPDPQHPGEIDGIWTVADGNGVCITEIT